MIDFKFIFFPIVLGLGLVRPLSSRVDKSLKLVGCFDLAVLPLVEVEVDDVARGDSAAFEFFRYALHDARLATTANAYDDLNHPLIVEEGSDLPEVFLAFVQIHRNLLRVAKYVELTGYFSYISRHYTPLTNRIEYVSVSRAS